MCIRWEVGATEKAPYILLKAYIERALWVGEQGGLYLNQMEALALTCFSTFWEGTSSGW